MERFAGQYFNRTIVICSVLVTLGYLLILVLSGETTLGGFFERIITGLFTAYSAFTCLFRLVIMMFINDTWLGNVQEFRFHISVGFLAGAIASIYKLFIDVWPIMRKLVAP